VIHVEKIVPTMQFLIGLYVLIASVSAVVFFQNLFPVPIEGNQPLTLFLAGLFAVAFIAGALPALMKKK
jgi:hypothetical protein